MSDAPPQPVKLALSSEQLQQDFIRVTMDRIPDPRWQYGLVVRKNVTKLRPKDGLAPPDAEHPVRSLGRLYREDVEADLEVYGIQARFEVDPVAWLEEWLRFNGLTPSATLRWPLLGGISGDIVAEWTIDGVRFAGRFATFKSGSRLFVACCRARRENYDRIADDFFLALSQFKLVQSDPTPLAEPLRYADGLSPVPWKLCVPGSWQVLSVEKDGPGGTIQAAATAPPASDRAAVAATTPFPGLPERDPIDWFAPTWSAQLSATLAPSFIVNSWDAAADLCLSTLRDAGLELEEKVFVEEAPLGRFEKSRSLVTPARLRGEPGAEARSRLANIGPVWFLSAGVGVARSVNPHAWMRNARAHDLVAQTVELEL
ncbi:MAG: hypothetical protein JO332_11155 [Planctomycetaceae bacterium]|nr:hypothetical protein [Planctomycetaceae bacterium]